MRRLSVLLLSGALVLTISLLACSREDKAQADASADAPAEQQEEKEWAVQTESVPSLTDAQAEVFSKATGFDDGVYNPVCVVATQVVSGTNHAFLCTGGGADGVVDGWYFVVIYEDLNGGASVSHIEKIDPNNLETINNSESGNFVGGWRVDPGATTIVPEQALEAFKKALSSQNERDLTPIATLATKDGLSQHYAVLCSQNDNSLIVVDVLLREDGSAVFSSFSRLSLYSYVTAA